jgi:hypothetical protein
MKADLRSILEELAPRIAHDPRPHATLRIGAMGHRVIDPAAHPRIVATVEQIFRLIRREAEQALARPAVREQFVERLELAVISPLAEGADRLITSVGEAQQYRLGAVLPFAPAEYETTFDLGDRVAAVTEFRHLLEIAAGPTGFGVLSLDGGFEPHKRDAAYLHCASVMLRWSDIVIAIVSAERANSQTGIGVQAAEKPGIPVILIDPARPDSFELRIAGTSPTTGAKAKEKLTALIAAILGDKSGSSGDASDMGGPRQRPHSLDGLADYCHERVQVDFALGCDFEYTGPYRVRPAAPIWARWCSGINRQIERCIKRFSAADAPERTGPPAPTLEDLLTDPIVARPVVALYLRYHRADQVADAYAELYRSAQMVIAFMGIATVMFALADAGVGWQSHFAGLELVSLLLTLSLAWIAYHKRWLDRWLDSRLLAEILRYSKFLLLIGRPSPFMELRGIQADESDDRVWTRNHVQHVLRGHRMAVPGRGQAPRDGAIADIARYILDRCIHDQIDYHRETQHIRKKFGELLQKWSFGFSIATIVVVAGKFALKLLLELRMLPDEHAIAPWVNLAELAASVFLALTMATLIMRAFGEYSIVAKRSAAVMNALKKEALLMRELINRTPDLERVGASMLRTTRVLLREVDGWFDLFADKHIEM